jgi:membrane protein
MAGAITFNVLVAIVPLLLLLAGLTGFALTARFGASTSGILEVVLTQLPTIRGDVVLTDAVERVLAGLIEERTGFSILGALILLWISTRLVGTLRVVLRQTFDLGTDRGILLGKLFDLRVVLLGGLLIFMNIGFTVGVRALQAFGIDLLGIEGTRAILLRNLTGQVLSFASAWVLFFLLYWHVPARRIPFRTAAVGATFTAVAYEVMKEAFAWYATSVATYSNAYGSLAVVAVLFFWIYYSAVVFILGGHVARAYEVIREKRMQRRELRAGGAESKGGGAVGVLLALLLTLPAAAAGQAISPFGGNGKNSGFLNGGEGVIMASASLDRNLSLERPLVQHDGPYVVVHIAENRVLVMEGTEVVWSSPAGTGHGFELEGQGLEWTFTTPIGMFRVLRKEKDPVWIAPDWYYVQRDLRIPAAADRARIPGTLGTSALFLGDGIAIHGTDRPDLLIDFPNPDDRRVSHGCIRLTNEAARELFHLVEVGTPVLIF